mmetsp:Transcript_35555/g.105087  ORF Transcript_35555/g.105087 Transcript_35555/m.105087 type:complete len:295 (+) Transcript_35555:478-1362(+)
MRGCHQGWARARGTHDARLDARKGALRGLDRRIDVRLGVRQRREAGLELRRRKVDALLEHRTVEAAKLCRVRLHGVLKAFDGASAEEEAKHARDVGAADLMTGVTRRCQQAIDEALGDLLQVLVRAWAAEDLERLEAGRHCQRVARQRAGLVHGPGRRNLHHNLLLAAVCAHRHAAADDLAHSGQVRRDPKVLLRTALGDAEAGHDLIKAQHRALRLRHIAQALQELLGRRDESRVANDRLQDHARDLSWVFSKDFFDRLHVIVRCGERRGRNVCWHTRRVRQTERQHARASLD